MQPPPIDHVFTKRQSLTYMKGYAMADGDPVLLVSQPPYTPPEHAAASTGRDGTPSAGVSSPLPKWVVNDRKVILPFFSALERER